MHDENNTTIIRDDGRNGQESPCLFLLLYFSIEHESRTGMTSCGLQSAYMVSRNKQMPTEI